MPTRKPTRIGADMGNTGVGWRSQADLRDGYAVHGGTVASGPGGVRRGRLRHGMPVYHGSQMREATVRRARLSASIAAQAAAASPASGPLSIANCKAYAIREPVSKRQYAILRLETTGGIVGWGETRAIAAADLVQAVAIL